MDFNNLVKALGWQGEINVPDSAVEAVNGQLGHDLFITKRNLIEQAVELILEVSGHPKNDPNIAETPKRVARAFLETWFSGYEQQLEDIVTTFPNQGDERDLVMVKDIPFYSMCAHHMAPFFGKAAIAYLPLNKVLGLSKFARVTDMYARRLQLQEKITTQVADALMSVLEPAGVMVVLYDVTHTCMTSRGVEAHGSTTSTSAVRGIFQTDAAIRAEALALLK